MQSQFEFFVYKINEIAILKYLNLCNLNFRNRNLHIKVYNIIEIIEDDGNVEKSSSSRCQPTGICTKRANYYEESRKKMKIFGENTTSSSIIKPVEEINDEKSVYDSPESIGGQKKTPQMNLYSANKLLFSREMLHKQVDIETA